MKIPIFLLIAAPAVPVLAHPGMARALAEIQARDDFILSARSTTLIGDLATSGATTKAGQTIKNILQGNEDATASKTAAAAAYSPPGALGSSACTADPLCVWYYVATAMWQDFTDSSGCTDLARGAIRQGFHDAGTWDTDQPSGSGGADGSLLLSTTELARSDNNGLQTIAAKTKTYYTTYHPYGAGMADIIQLGAIVGTVACPGGPRIRAFSGRIDSSQAAPTGKLPSTFASAASLVALFARKTFNAADLVALVGAHTSARQRFVDPARANAALDPDPQLWDASFYSDVKAGNNQTFFILPSDRALSTYSATSARWNAFAATNGQTPWNPSYAQAYFRMSMLGVGNMNSLTEITAIVPSR